MPPDPARGARDRPGAGLGSRSLKALLRTSDVCSVVVAWLAYLFVAGAGAEDRHLLALAGCAGALAVVAMLHQQRLYVARVSGQRMLEAAGILRSSVVGGLAVGVAQSLLPLPFAPVHALTYGAASGALLLGSRSLYRAWLRSRRRAGDHVRRVIVVGDNEETAELVELLDDHPELGLRIAGVLSDHSAGGDRIGGSIDGAVAAARNLDASGAIVVASALSAPQLHGITRDLLAAGLHVHLSSGLTGVSRTRILPVSLAHESLLYLEPPHRRGGQPRMKRAVDLIGSTAVLALTLPMWVVVAVLIKLDSPGPVFFRQERIGLDGRIFSLVKFRTMIADAESARAALQVVNERVNSPLFKMAVDPRVTRVGRVLRATSIDELPQLINVLSGSMSMVGPRPALPHEVEHFDEQLRTRLDVKPGITGLWQIEARDHPSFGPYRRLDLFYVENWSLTLDLLIMVGTVTSVGARILSYLIPALRADAVIPPS